MFLKALKWKQTLKMRRKKILFFTHKHMFNSWYHALVEPEAVDFFSFKDALETLRLARVLKLALHNGWLWVKVWVAAKVIICWIRLLAASPTLK